MTDPDRLRELVKLGRAMRKAQREYSARRNPNLVPAAKALEGQFDRLLDEADPDRPRGLFDREGIDG